MSRQRAVDFVYFDAGMTLLRVRPSVGWHYAEIAREFGVEAEPMALTAGFIAAWRHCQRHCAVHPDVAYGLTQEESLGFWSEVVRETFRQSGQTPPGDPAYYRRVFEAFASARCWELYPDVEPALEYLAGAGLRFGVLSNWDRRLRQTLTELEMLPRLAALVISSEVGAEKPSDRIFAAARTAAHGASRFGLVGDEPEADGFGALRAGWRQCLVWRSEKPAPEGLRSAPSLTEAVRRLVEES